MSTPSTGKKPSPKARIPTWPSTVGRVQLLALLADLLQPVPELVTLVLVGVRQGAKQVALLILELGELVLDLIAHVCTPTRRSSDRGTRTENGPSIERNSMKACSLLARATLAQRITASPSWNSA